jgi:2-methylisocitrate lyase-like PEP mutase family enzyme
MSPEDRALVAEIARSRGSDPIPAFMRDHGLAATVEHLADLGVTTIPAGGTPIGAVIEQLRVDCRAWDAANP